MVQQSYKDEAVEGLCCKGEWIPWPTLPRLLPVFFILLIGFIIYTTYMAFYCVPMLQFDVEPQYRDADMRADGIFTIIYIHIFLILFLVSFFLTSATDPGKIPDNEYWKSQVDAAKMKEKKRKTGGIRFCPFEQKYKPDRAHYCRPMARNVLKMDHFCPWVANAIGHYNYKYFLLSIFYSTFELLYMAFTMTGALVPLFKNPNVPFGVLFYMFLGDVMCVFLAAVVVPFLVFHIWMMIHNTTTVEFCHGKYGMLSMQSRYDVGWIRNTKLALGSNPWLWLLPVGGPEGDGLFFPENVGHASKSSDE